MSNLNKLTNLAFELAGAMIVIFDRLEELHPEVAEKFKGRKDEFVRLREEFKNDLEECQRINSGTEGYQS